MTKEYRKAAAEPGLLARLSQLGHLATVKQLILLKPRSKGLHYKWEA